MSGHPTPELLGGYVLHDLAGHESEVVETHLLTCPECRAEVARLRDALHALADDLPPAPVPDGAWERLQAKRRVAAAPPAPISRASRAFTWPLAAAVAALLALGGYAAWTSIQPPSEQATVQQWKRQGARELSLKNQQGQEFGLLFVRADEQCLILLRRPPPQGQVYQVWGRRQGGPNAGVPISLGLTAGTLVQVYYGEFDSMGVSLEPDGGSPAPTHPLGRVNLPKT